MTTKNLLNVDYFRSLLIDDPSSFMDLNERNGFEAALRAEVSDLIREVEIRISSAESKDRILLIAKFLDSLGRPNWETEWVKKHFPNFEDRQEDILTAEQQLAKNSTLMSLNLFHYPQHFLFINGLNSNRDNFEKITNVCNLMKTHKKLVALIANTPNLNVGLNLKKPEEVQQAPSDAPILGLHKPPAADNNRNCSWHDHPRRRLDVLAMIVELENM